MGRINIEIPDDTHACLKTIASAQGMQFYEYVKEILVSFCPHDRTLTEMVKGIRAEQQAAPETT